MDIPELHGKSNTRITEIQKIEVIKRRQNLLRDCEVILAAQYDKGGRRWTELMVQPSESPGDWERGRLRL